MFCEREFYKAAVGNITLSANSGQSHRWRVCDCTAINIMIE